MVNIQHFHFMISEMKPIYVNTMAEFFISLYKLCSSETDLSIHLVLVILISESYT